ncbi:hypothetical protein C8R44DRAFT_736985 [Mycena epipterygia]|nr:hypothetical protein C8R44DRAFT_736985 [Mycena epipterygia]
MFGPSYFIFASKDSGGESPVQNFDLISESRDDDGPNRRPLEENCNIAIPGARDACAPPSARAALLPETETTGTHAEYMYMYMTLYFLLSSSSESPYALSVHANEGGAHCFLRGAVPAVLGVRNKDFAAQWQMEIALIDADFEAPPSMPRKNLVLFLLPGNLLFDANLKGCN